MSVSSYQKSSSPINLLGVPCLAPGAKIWKNYRHKVAARAPAIRSIHQGIAGPAASPALVAKLVPQNLVW